MPGRAARDRRHARWLGAARRGDGEAFRSLYRDLYAPVSAYVRRRVGRREDAEDLVAEVFHRFVGRLEAFDRRRGSPTAWLLTIAHHAVIDHYRQAGTRSSTDAASDVHPSDPPSPLDEMLAGERMRRLRDLVAELPTPAQEILALRFGHELRFREIAALTGTSEAAAKQRCSRAVRELRELMEGGAS